MNLHVTSSTTSVDPEIEILYDPVRWRARLGCVPLGSNLNLRERLIETFRKQSDICRNDTSDVGFRQFGIAYGDPGQPNQGTEAFDWYAPVSFNETECHVVVYIHGGFWRALDLAESSHWVVPVTKAGGVYVALGYRLAPWQTIEMMPKRICKGLEEVYRYSLERIKILTERKMTLSLHLVGHSAGAHLAFEAAMHAAQHSEEKFTWLSSLNSLILVSGLYDLRPLVHTSYNTVLKFESEDQAWQCSPYRYFAQPSLLCDLSVQWFIGWAEYDPPAFIQEAKDMLNHFHNMSKFDVKSFIVINEDHFSTMEQLFYGREKSKLLQQIFEFIGL